jgi:glycosyltransferase involved in cell wall biosynthesis
MHSVNALRQISCVGNSWFTVNPGGLERYVHELTHYLSSKDAVEVLGVDLPEVEANTSLKFTSLGDAYSPFLKGLWDACCLFQKRSITYPDAVNFHFAYYALPLLMALPSKTATTFTFHGPWASEARQEGLGACYVQMMYWIERYVYHRCDRFIVLSQAFAALLHEQYKVPWPKIHIIPGGVNTTQFQPNLTRQQARVQLGWPQDRPVLFTPRRLCHRMGLLELLEAMVQVKLHVPDIWLAIAGQGPLWDVLAEQILELGLENHILLTGYISDEELAIAYQATNLTVVPSQTLEGFGLVLVESLACGTPVICTPVGGMPEVVEPLCPALVTQAIDPRSIGRCLIQALTEDFVLPSRNVCREYAVKNFDWKVIVPRIRQVLLS